MLQLVRRASDVRIQEINLSAVISGSSVTVAALPIVSRQGSTSPLLFTNSTDFLNEYGNPDPSVSMTIQSGLNYLSQGNQLWAVRAVGAGAMYGCVLLYSDNTDITRLRGVAVADPKNTDLSTLVNPDEEAIALFYGIHGPGSYANDLAVQIVTNQVNAPTSVNASASPTGGQLPSATYTYLVSSISSNGESLPSTPATIVVSGISQPTGKVTLSWPGVPGAIGYNIYGRVSPSGGFGFIAQVGANTTTFGDTGAILPDANRQPVSSSADASSSDSFNVVVYDTSIPQQGPLENWTCTLVQQLSAAGEQMYIEDRINPFSQYLQVVSNVPALPTVPTMESAPKTNMAGGNSGATPTTSQIIQAMQVFSNRELYGTNTFINGGISVPDYQLAMDSLVQKRGDAVSLLDTPSAMQKFQDAVNYRNLNLNLNSTYSALFNPDVLQVDRINGQQVYVPMSGWAGALCAYTDRITNQAHSIAGLNRGLLPVLKQRYTYDDGQATAMFDAQVNYVRTFVGQGIALWEQQTLAAQQSALSWLNVRRCVNAIKVALYQYLLYALQEQDTDALRRSIVNSLTTYLDTWVNAKGLSSFQVVCDKSNNPAAAVNAAVLVVTVILVPTLAVHEVQLQMVISKAGVDFAETLAQVTGNTQ